MKERKECTSFESEEKGGKGGKRPSSTAGIGDRKIIPKTKRCLTSQAFKGKKGKNGVSEWDRRKKKK